MTQYHKILKKYWGFDEFKKDQLEAIESVCSRKDTMVVMPTGGGKSLIYQLSTLYVGGVTLVISPLIALMDDQVQQLKERGIAAAVWHSGQTYREQNRALQNLVHLREPRLLYISPERLDSEAFLEFCSQIKIQLLAVDEAHCISQWGHDFRPAFRRISKFREKFPEIPIVALTATATPRVQDDVINQLKMVDPAVFRQSIYKPNLSIYVYKETDKFKFIARHVKNLKGSGILYIRNRKGTEEIARMLSGYGLNGMYYHAGVDARERRIIQEKWVKGAYRFVVATNAFGMGIDKSDVRWIIHMSPVSSIEEYYQEIGRAGRDGQQAKVYLLWNEEDLESMDQIIQMAYPDKAVLETTLRRFVHYHQIPVGQEYIVQKFNMNTLSEETGFSPFQIHRVFTLLQKMGIVEYQEPVAQKGKVTIRGKPHELSEMKIKQPLLYEIIDYLARTKDNAFWSSLTIETEELSDHLSTSIQDVENRLMSLARHHFIDYQPAAVYGQVLFVNGRQELRTIRYDMALVKMLRKRQKESLMQMVQYIDNEECRFRFLQEYFGEEPMQHCKHCDIYYQNIAKAGSQVRINASQLLEAIPADGMDLYTYVVESDNEFLAREVVRNLYRMQKIKYLSGKIYKN